MQQLSLSFEPGLAQRSRTLREHFSMRVYHHGFGKVCGILDCGSSALTEKLAGITSDGRKRNVSLDDLEAYIAATGDVSPIHYLLDKYMRDPRAQQEEALAALIQLAQQVPALAAAAGLKLPASAPKRGAR